MTDLSARAPRKKLTGRLVALALGSVVALGVGETFARAEYGRPWPEHTPLLRIQAHATRGWEMVPSEDHYTYESLVRVNSLGLRGPEIEQRREGEARVLVLGDSLTYGQGMGEAETLPAQTQALLTTEGDDWTVVNGGLRAYATNQELALLEELAGKIEPDIVVLAWYWNDLLDSNISGNYERFTASGPVTFDLAAPAEGLPLWTWRARQLLRRSALFMQLYDLLPKERRETALDPARREELLAHFGEHLARFEELAREYGFRFGVFLVPDSNALRIGDDHASQPLVQEIRELLAERGIRARYGRTELSKAIAVGGAQLIIPYDGHYTAEGNACLARELAAFARELATLAPPR